MAAGWRASLMRRGTTQLVGRAIADANEQAAILKLIRARSPQDAYYQAWIRVGDINVTMRLRDWRPNGEVIAPLALRHAMLTEALQELSHYQTPSDERPS